MSEKDTDDIGLNDRRIVHREGIAGAVQRPFE